MSLKKHRRRKFWKSNFPVRESAKTPCLCHTFCTSTC